MRQTQIHNDDGKFTLQSSNHFLSVHPCDVKNNGCTQKCIKKGDVALCGCKQGFKLAADNKTCVKGMYTLCIFVSFHLFYTIPVPMLLSGNSGKWQSDLLGSLSITSEGMNGMLIT